MAAAARPLVSIQALDGDGGDSKMSCAFAAVMLAPIRPNIVEFVHANIAKNKRQPYGVSKKSNADVFCSHSTSSNGGLPVP
jgi:large subunit ribosomal protein L4e